ncbi:hypothetical protein MBLNU457_5412t1 [Dothideomycetes sp. NU457]
MPNYEIEHICPLTESQKDEIAEAITHIHTKQFTAPRLFVNCRFTNIKDHAVYVAGKRRTSNRIFAYVRHGPSRTQADYKSVSEEIIKAWDRIVPLPMTKRAETTPDTELRMVMFFGAITAVYEAGFMMPEAGHDGEWLKEHEAAFEEKAKAGDEEFAEMLKEVRERGML